MEDPVNQPNPSQPTERTIRSDEAAQPSLNLTFISIHDLSPEARILYSSESILDVLGYTPDEVVNRSVWEFFSDEEMQLAKAIHQNGIEGDKAAMLVYCKVKDSNGDWIGCECCFTIVYDVMVVCTSVYKSGVPSQKRALEAPVVRRIFTSSPKDPRYHMLTHLSHKFRPSRRLRTPHEPRAALFLNRFTRTLTIMYATAGIQDILGISSSELQGKSFYYCIAENCLSDAVRCLENAKGNDSIAYLRFWFRNPLQPDSSEASEGAEDSTDLEMTDTDEAGRASQRTARGVRSDTETDEAPPSASSADSTAAIETRRAIFGGSVPHESSASSISQSPPAAGSSPSIELEAVVSCASDGLVVCLRRARPSIPAPTQRPSPPPLETGLFAAPWADVPILPSDSSSSVASGPAQADFMAAIREQAVFAWALTGINGALHAFATGSPLGESTPANGMPVWSGDSSEEGSARGSVSSQAVSPVDSRHAGNDHRAIFGDPGIKHSRMSDASQNPPR